MKTGICPKCNAHEVFKLVDAMGMRDCRSLEKIDSGKVRTSMESYVCTDCGYFENYIVDAAHLAAIKSGGDWVKAGK
jgi:hypothetical protein